MSNDYIRLNGTVIIGGRKNVVVNFLQHINFSLFASYINLSYKILTVSLIICFPITDKTKELLFPTFSGMSVYVGVCHDDLGHLKFWNFNAATHRCLTE